MVLNDAAFSQLHEHLRQRNGAKFAWTTLWHLLPWLWFLGSTIKWGNRSRRIFAVLCGTVAVVQMPIHSIAAVSALRQPLGPGSAASTTPLTTRFTNFAGGGVNFEQPD